MHNQVLLSSSLARATVLRDQELAETPENTIHQQPALAPPQPSVKRVHQAVQGPPTPLGEV